LGTILLQKGIAAEAIESLDKAWKKSPNRADIQLHLARALAAAGKMSQARDVLHELLAASEPFMDRGQAQKLLEELGD
jgi:thioredoxin-like negative regulator of GroEL